MQHRTITHNPNRNCYIEPKRIDSGCDRNPRYYHTAYEHTCYGTAYSYCRPSNTHYSTAYRYSRYCRTDQRADENSTTCAKRDRDRNICSGS